MDGGAPECSHGWGTYLHSGESAVAAGSLAYWQGDMETAEHRYEEGLDVSRELEDKRGIAQGLFNLAFPYAIRGRPDSAERFLLEARRTFEELGDEQQAAFATSALGMAGFMSGAISEDELERSRALTREAHAGFEAIGDAFGMALTSGMIGVRAFHAGDLEEARARLTESLEAYLDLGDMLGVAVVLDATAVMAGRAGRHDVGLRLVGATSRLKEDARGQAPPPMLRLEDPKELAQGSLSPEQIGAALDSGRALDIDAVIALARRELAADDEG
jgi:tetratricopeptide (TPR) repeat protein